MQTRRGIAVSPGVAISQAVVIDAEDRPVPKRMVAVSRIPEERARLDEALAASLRDIETLRDETQEKFGSELARIFGYHIGMLQDQFLTDQIHRTIESQRVVAEYAVYETMREMARRMMMADSPMFRDRVRDVWDLEKRILAHLIGDTQESLNHLDHDAIVVAHDLTPSQTASLDKSHIKAIATDAGGLTSHTAILAHALGIPAIVGLEDVTSVTRTGDMVIIDGNRGVAVVDPGAEQLMEYREEVRVQARQLTSLGELASLPARTTDGTDITLLANIEFPTEIADALARGAAGIGLYRTEFLYLATETEPSELQHYEAYAQSVRALEGRPLTLRTLDLGADKIVSHDFMEHSEQNPFLGCRSIRLCLQNPALFRTQLRAILRASVDGPVKVMFPLISNIMELRQAKMILSDVQEDLAEEGIAFRSDIPVGIMVEVPSTALQISTYCREVDFVSIGTNDLIQYTVAVDRGNERIANLYSAAHPALIQLVRDVTRTANRLKTEVSLCGEMAGDVVFTMLLLGLGLRNLSITPPAIPEVKKVIRSVSINQCQRIARKVAGFESDREVYNYLREALRRLVPDVSQSRRID